MDDEIRTYFPQPGDSPGVIAQKAQSRAVVNESMRVNAGTAIEGASRAASTAEIPKAALMNLKEGKVTTFKNGQKWTLRNGKPERVQ